MDEWSDEQIAGFWESHDAADFWEEMQPVELTFCRAGKKKRNPADANRKPMAAPKQISKSQRHYA